MIWVVRRGRIPPNLPPDERRHFEEIDLESQDCDTKELADELDQKGFRLWVKEDLDRNFGRSAERKYETFVGGFLTYHEMYVNNTERKIFFEWCHRGHLDYVRIFIDKPSGVIADPPKPKGPPPPESV